MPVKSSAAQLTIIAGDFNFSGTTMGQDVLDSLEAYVSGT